MPCKEARIIQPRPSVITRCENLQNVVDDVRIGEDIDYWLKNGTSKQIIEKRLQRDALEAVLGGEEWQEAARKIVNITDLLVPTVRRGMHVGADQIVVSTCKDCRQ